MNSFRLTTFSIFLVLLAFVLFVGGLAPYYLFYIFILTLLLPLIHSLITLRKIQGNVKIPIGSLYVGDKIEIEYRVENNSRFWVTYIEIQSNITYLLTGKISEKSVLNLRPKSGFTKKETVVLNKRGYYDLGEINVTIHDVFDFYSFNKNISSNSSLLVYPEIIRLSSLKTSANNKSGEMLAESLTFQDRNNIASLRDYREGDSIKSVHWKLTAKKDSTIVKDYEHRVDTNTVIFLNNENSLYMDDVNRRLEDKAVDVALSIISYCLDRNLEVILETQNEGRYIRIKGKQSSDLKPYLEELTRLRGNGALNIKALISTQMDVISKGTTVIVISPNLDKTLGSIGIELRAKNLYPILIIVTDRENNTGFIDTSIEKRLLEEGVPIYNIDYDSSIKDILEV